MIISITEPNVNTVPISAIITQVFPLLYHQNPPFDSSDFFFLEQSTIISRTGFIITSEICSFNVFFICIFGLFLALVFGKLAQAQIFIIYYY